MEKFKDIREEALQYKDEEPADQWECAGSIQKITKEIQALLGPDPGEASPVVQERGRSPGGGWHLFSKDHPQ